ncbi:MAG: thioredoxin domain-containing protein [Candidatus Methanofastidiosia archaeon]
MKKRLAPYIILVLGIVFLIIGVLPQYDDVTRSKNISSVICLSCLGITNTTSDYLVIDDLTKIQYTEFEQDIVIYIFSTETCKSCPRVIAMCQELARFSENVTAIEVKYDNDVELFRELAAQYNSDAESVGVPWVVVTNENDDYESWLYESYITNYPKPDDIRYIIQVIDMVVKLGTAEKNE